MQLLNANLKKKKKRFEKDLTDFCFWLQQSTLQIAGSAQLLKRKVNKLRDTETKTVIWKKGLKKGDLGGKKNVSKYIRCLPLQWTIERGNNLKPWE